MNQASFQDQGTVRHCFGCGADNAQGLHLKSYWDGDEAVAIWKAEPHHCGEYRKIVTGGIIACLIDCHAVNLAIAHCYSKEGRTLGSNPRIFCVSANLNIDFRKPVPIDQNLELRANVTKVEGRKIWVRCFLSAGGQICAQGEVLSVRLKESGDSNDKPFP